MEIFETLNNNSDLIEAAIVCYYINASGGKNRIYLKMICIFSTKLI